MLVASIKVNDSAPIDVLVDTGSSGLRVFREALHGTAVDTTAEPASVEFGGGVKWDGHVANANVTLGDVTAKVAFQLVESHAGDLPAVQGVLGIGLRAGEPASVYNPLAQIDETGFVIKTGGFDSKSATIVLAAGETAIQLAAKGKLPNGKPAWGDDEIDVCFTIAGAAPTPPCTNTVLDTGSNFDIVYAPKLPAEQMKDGLLAPGVAFEAVRKDAFDLKYTVGTNPLPSVDGIMVDDTDPFAILGVATFFRYDVSYDLANGRIGLAPLR